MGSITQDLVVMRSLVDGIWLPLSGVLFHAASVVGGFFNHTRFDLFGLLFSWRVILQAIFNVAKRVSKGLSCVRVWLQVLDNRCFLPHVCMRRPPILSAVGKVHKFQVRPSCL